MSAVDVVLPSHHVSAVFHALVRRRIRATFDAMSRGDYSIALDGLADELHHVFAGDHALGGERHSREAVRRWFERLFRQSDLRFDVQRVLVLGRHGILLWASSGSGTRPPRPRPYLNEGVHVIRIRCGRVVYFHAYEDIQKVADACRRMADAGIEEAAAAPIVD